MQFARIRHKGLRRLYEDGSTKGVAPERADKLRKLMFALDTADDLDQLSRFPVWKLHPLKGDLNGFWSLTVTGNWRLISAMTKRLTRPVTSTSSTTIRRLQCP